MSYTVRSLLLFVLFLCLQLPDRVQAAAWYDGLIKYSLITNCFSIIQGAPYQEFGAGTYVGFLADPNNGLPAPNTTYYTHVVVSGMGNSCSGIRAYLEVALPANTSLAIDSSNPVYCLFDGVQITPASDCPQSLPPSKYNSGAYAIWSTDAAHANTWPLPLGHTIEIRIPVKSSTTLSNNPFQANVWLHDGNSSPWLSPQQGVYVFSNQPEILYASPSTDNITSTSAVSRATLYTFGKGGSLYFELGTTTGYGMTDSGNIPPGQNNWLLDTNWPGYTFQPDTLYHWRVRFEPDSGPPVIGIDQTFRTLPDGRVKVGSGQASGCTEAAFNSALATAKDIIFDCGALPVTINLTSSHSITSNLVINGGNKINLAANGATNHFNVQAGAHLTLNQITLSNGYNTSDCGGSVKVLASGQLTLHETRFDSNRSFNKGGAVCNHGSATISYSLFTNNASLYSHGGAIGNYGNLDITSSKFKDNTSGANGGGIDTVGAVTVTGSTFDNNTAAWRGGGINSYYGTLTMVDSSFTGNTAGIYGGGIANDATVTTISGSSFWSNSSSGVGGGIEISGPGTITIINSDITASPAVANPNGILTIRSGKLTANRLLLK